MRAARRPDGVPDLSEATLVQAATLAIPAAEQSWAQWRRSSTVQDCPGRDHAMLSIVASRLGAVALGTDAPVLQGLRRRTWAVNQRAASTLRQILAAMAEVGTSAVLSAEGAWLVDPSGVPGRPVPRVGLWVAADDIPEVEHVLAATGFRRQSRRRPWNPSVTWLATDGTATHVAVSGSFPHGRRTPLTGPETSPIRWQGREIMVLSDVHRLVDSLIEGLLPRTQVPLTWPADAALLVSRNLDQEGFWDRVVADSRTARRERVVGAGLRWLAAHLGLAVPVEVTAQLQARSDLRAVVAAERHPSRAMRAWDVAAARVTGRLAPSVRPSDGRAPS